MLLPPLTCSTNVPDQGLQKVASTPMAQVNIPQFVTLRIYRAAYYIKPTARTKANSIKQGL